jgi:release factor glutamine methyltransferase
MNNTIAQIVTTCAKQLLPVCPQPHDAEQEAWWLIEHVTGKRKVELITSTVSHDKVMLASIQEKLNDLITQRVELKKPLQYILGNVPFGNLTIKVVPPILIPRPETEEWVLWLISQCTVNQPNTILDLCTGSGCIGLQLAHAFPKATVLGIDNNPEAIVLAEENKKLNNLTNITFRQGDLYAPLKATDLFDLIVANPPYLAQEEWERLDPQVTLWEDKQALVAANKGMKLYEQILAKASSFLQQSTDSPSTHPLPRIVLEIGPAQHHIETLADQYGFTKNRVFVDSEGKRRWLTLYV